MPTDSTPFHLLCQTMSDFDPTTFEFEYGAKRVDSSVDDSLIGFIPQGSLVLDAGCGAGRLAIRIAGRAKMVYGIDISEKMLALARARETESNCRNVRWLQGSIELLPVGACIFDAVVSTNVLQYVDIQRALLEFKRVLKPGGKLALSNWTVDNSIRSSGFLLLRQLRIARDAWMTHGMPSAFKYIQSKLTPPSGLNTFRVRPLTSPIFQEETTRVFPGTIFQQSLRRIVAYWENS